MQINNGYKSAINYAKKHYENFPVVSFLIPKKLRKHIAIIYWFARTADDIADEGNIPQEDRLRELNNFQNRLGELLKGNFNNSFESALASSISEKKLSPNLFYDLLRAFKQDVVKKRYNSFNELLNYCRYSANPVGRLILQLFNIRDEEACLFSDKICTALQLTNFWQDISLDFEKGRIYLPFEEMEKFFISERSFELKEINPNFKKLLEFNITKTEELFSEGRGLLNILQGRLKYEISWTILGGEAILNKIKKNNYNVLNKRPALTKKDYFFLLIKSFM